MADPFVATTNQWVRDSKKRLTAVFLESAQQLFSDAQKPVGAGGNMPIDTGFLRASLVIGVGGSEASVIFGSSTEAKLGADPDISVAIASATAGDTIFGGWTAEYAAYQHFVIGHLWVDKAVQNWQSIVTANVQRLKGLF